MSNYKILVANPEPETSGMLSKLLETFEMEYKLVESGLEVFNALSEDVFDLLITHMELPDTNGKEVASRIRNELGAPLNQLPIIGISETEISPNGSGINAIVSPPNPVDLENEIYDILEPEELEQPKKMSESIGAKLYDLTFLNDYADGDEVFVREMITMFLTDTPEMLDLLVKYNKEENWEQLKEKAHKIKSQMSFMGLKFCHEQTDKIEQAAANKTYLGEITQMIESVNTYCSKVFSQLKNDYGL